MYLSHITAASRLGGLVTGAQGRAEAWCWWT